MTDIHLLPVPVHLSLPFYTLPHLHFVPVCTFSAPVSTLPLLLYVFPVSLSLTTYIVSMKILELLSPKIHF